MTAPGTKRMIACDLTPEMVLDSMNEGVYVTDTDRRIVYWGKVAERITGWTAEAVLGKHCRDDLLCHIDKDGHRLCGEEYCPLHRCILTGTSSTVPIIVFASTPRGRRVPLQVAVAPLRNEAGEIIGGVETFRDLTDEWADISRARRIQTLALQQDLPADPRIRITPRYIPCDVIGGDYYACVRLDNDRYGLLLADVAGHGVPAALYTMFLNSLWAGHVDRLVRPLEFAHLLNSRLLTLIHESEPFVAAVCGLIDLAGGELRLVAAGNPGPLVIRSGGRWESPNVGGPPLGIIDQPPYQETVLGIQPGDSLLFFSDGAVEFTEVDGQRAGRSGLERVLRKAGYPASSPDFGAIEAEMLAASDRIRFEDDVTFIDVRIC